MKALLKVWIDANALDGADKVAARVREKCELADLRAVEEYHKGGFEARFEVAMASQRWPEAIYELILRAQTPARDWTITGPIEEEAYLVSNHVLIPGATAAHIVVSREEPNQSLEPTPMLGTSAAEQPLVPSTGVAHL